MERTYALHKDDKVFVFKTRRENYEIVENLLFLPKEGVFKVVNGDIEKTFLVQNFKAEERSLSSYPIPFWCEVT